MRHGSWFFSVSKIEFTKDGVDPIAASEVHAHFRFMVTPNTTPDMATSKTVVLR